MKIYDLPDIDKAFRETIACIDNDNKECLHFQVKSGALLLAIHTYKEQLIKGMAIHPNKSNVISALEAVEEKLDFKPFSSQSNEMANKLLASFIVYGEYLPHNQAN